MLKVNVGLSRKVSRDYNSTGFSVNLEGEVCVPLDDPEGVVEKIKELYDLAEESLNQQIERYEGETTIASRDEVPPTRQESVPARSANGNGRGNGYERHSSPPQNGNGQRRTGDDGFTPASNKQISYLNNLAKRQGLTTPQLRQRVAEIVGREVDLYDLSKSEAGIVLDELTAENSAPTGRRR
ncbi:hypothetical protein [Rubinisphaera sp. JC750]|uniref:hypothetical protein n=1 Tax=Rubinisphaera sp. JC750 TaxID=2898658 RepID=UPI001F1D8C4A|nr:hypothetical protein [Rubinisphaera sp. JC750]